MSCDNHTSKPKQVLSQNGGVLPENQHSLVIQVIKEKIADNARLTEEELCEINQLPQKLNVMIEAMKNGYRFTAKEILFLKNPTNNNGETFAHLMAYAGHKFSIGELLELENPTNHNGFTVLHIMKRMGYELTRLDDFRLEYGFVPIPLSELVWMLEQNEEIPLAEVIQYPDLVERYADRLI